VIVVHESDGLHHIVVVLEGFSHAHEYDAEALCRTFQHQKRLRDDFVCRQVASEAELSRQTECAAEAAANLR